MEDRVSIHFSVEDGIIEVEQKKGPLISRKEISRDQLLNCFRKSVYIREDAPPVLSSGVLPLNTLAVRQTKESVSVVVWYPRLRADLSLYKTPYPDFPIPRLVFGFSVGAADGAVSACRIGVIADETPTPDTIMYHYPFSNVDSSGSLCIGANTLPKYKELRKAAGLPALLLSIPNNFDRFDPSDNQLGLDYRDLMQHLKDKEPAYYYDNLEADPNVDALSCCQDAQELFALYQTCASRRQIDTLLQNYLDTMQAVKAARGRIYFIPRDYMPKLALFEDFIALLEQHNQHKYADRLPLDANSMFVVDDEKQRSKMALAFYRTIQKDLAEYEKRATHLIQSGNQSPAIMDRMVLSIRELERKKIYYESILKQELHEVDEQYTSLRYLSDELQIRARSIQAQKRLAA